MRWLRQRAIRKSDRADGVVASSAVESRIIGVSLLTSPIHRRLIGLGQWRTGLQALDQIGVGNIGQSERDQVGFVFCQLRICQRQVIAIVCHIRILEATAQRGIVERRDIPGTAGRTFDDVQIHKIERIQFIDQIIELGLRIASRHAIGRRYR